MRNSQWSVKGNTKFLITLTHQLLEKLPNNVTTIQELRLIAPNSAIASVGRPRFEQLPFDLAVPDIDIDKLEAQWRSLGTLTLKDINPEFSDGMEIDSVKFWGNVRQLSNAIGETPYEQLADFCLKALTLPVSNAVVERVFSIMNAVKTRARNKMQLEILQCIIRIRVHLKEVLKSCCIDFQPSHDMLMRFTSQMYESTRNPKDLGTPRQTSNSTAEGEDLLEMITLFDNDNESHDCL
ncbi:hypothetical protein R5R35_010347 [Gryllus longicercus]|uniref:HAT C-terminal dimerisation domain-containing protein n=1 Tax=Gryllus longicercus TaxID=2509291 RepID=A0AAN9W480_9ORTH